jgi:sugar phosphate isomerase/epimerase
MFPEWKDRMVQPKIGLSMLYMLGQPFEMMLSELRNSPTEFVEIVDDGYHTLNKKRVRLLNEVADSRNLKYSVHAPFADLNVASLSKTVLNASMKRLKQSLKHASALNAYLWVFHPGNKSGISSFYPGLDWQQNTNSILELHEIAKDLGLRIAMENLPEKYNFLMKNPEDFFKFYKETGLENVGIVLDTGHANLENKIEPYMLKLSNRIVHVHVSDNHGEVDEHLGLGYGKIDWNLFVKGLKTSGFNGTILVESIFNIQETIARLMHLFS